MTNGMDPGRMTTNERLDEVSMLLALAMMRLWIKRHSARVEQRAFSRDSAQVGRDCLELTAATSPHGAVDPVQEN